MNKSLDIEAQQWFNKDVRKPLFIAAFHDSAKFFKGYVILQGFRDGGHGFVLAVLMGIYFFIARVKVWALWYKYDHNT